MLFFFGKNIIRQEEKQGNMVYTMGENLPIKTFWGSPDVEYNGAWTLDKLL